MLLAEIVLPKLVAVEVPVVEDGGAQAVLQIVQVALQRGWGYLQFVEQGLKAHMAAVADERFDFVNPSSLGHDAARLLAQGVSLFNCNRMHPKFGGQQARDLRCFEAGHQPMVARHSLRI